jgi:argonaute-like protein implicated in RNA metabolism and viral defense
MPRSKKKIKKSILSEKDKRKAEKEALRKVLKESGQLSIPVHKVHKNKKKYDRIRVKRELDEDLE